MPDPLDTEIATYKKLHSSLLQNEGKYAVVAGEELIGVYGTYEEALQAGYEKAKLLPFLVKKITGTELVVHV
jgi:hypothetical protein